ncbi:PcfB family protein, partial [Dysosmobacter welbionis]
VVGAHPGVVHLAVHVAAFSAGPAGLAGAGGCLRLVVCALEARDLLVRVPQGLVAGEVAARREGLGLCQRPVVLRLVLVGLPVVGGLVLVALVRDLVPAHGIVPLVVVALVADIVPMHAVVKAPVRVVLGQEVGVLGVVALLQGHQHFQVCPLGVALVLVHG